MTLGQKYHHCPPQTERLPKIDIKVDVWKSSQHCETRIGNSGTRVDGNVKLSNLFDEMMKWCCQGHWGQWDYWGCWFFWNSFLEKNNRISSEFFFHPSELRLWRSRMLILTKSKGHKLNVWIAMKEYHHYHNLSKYWYTLPYFTLEDPVATESSIVSYPDPIVGFLGCIQLRAAS